MTDFEVDDSAGSYLLSRDHLAGSAEQHNPEYLEPILLVDDNPVNLQILYKTLDGCGYKLYVARDGRTALSIASSVRPSLILLDIVMPGIDGYEVCKTLKADPQTKDISIIFLSALEDSAAKVKGFSVGGVDYISKPFRSDEVVARVRSHIKIHQLERQFARRNLELETENRQILNSISEGIIGLDSDGRITMLNPSASIICGWSAGESIGKHISSLKLFDEDNSFYLPIDRDLPYPSYHLGQALHSDMELIRRRDHEQLAVSVTSTPRPEGGAVIVLRDISEWVASEENLRFTREELELQRQHMAHMERLSTTGEMAAGIAHEVNQPLAAIANYSVVARRLLEREDIDRAKLIELLDKLRIQSQRASDVILRMRSYVKKPDVGRESTDINKLLHEVIALAEVDSRINDVGVHFTPADDLPIVAVDVVQIQQVALNLIRNGMESMADSSSRRQGLLVSTSCRGSMITIKIIDGGVGVADEAKNRLFEPFFTTKSAGMGIGLPICESIVHSHGGEIGYEPNTGSPGSTFYFSLPCG